MRCPEACLPAVYRSRQAGIDKELGGAKDGPRCIAVDSNAHDNARCFPEFHRREELLRHSSSLLPSIVVIKGIFVNFWTKP